MKITEPEIKLTEWLKSRVDTGTSSCHVRIWRYKERAKLQSSMKSVFTLNTRLTLCRRETMQTFQRNSNQTWWKTRTHTPKKLNECQTTEPESNCVKLHTLNAAQLCAYDKHRNEPGQHFLMVGQGLVHWGSRLHGHSGKGESVRSL